jgi:hypothetical protein
MAGAENRTPPLQPVMLVLLLLPPPTHDLCKVCMAVCKLVCGPFAGAVLLSGSCAAVSQPATRS